MTIRRCTRYFLCCLFFVLSMNTASAYGETNTNQLIKFHHHHHSATHEHEIAPIQHACADPSGTCASDVPSQPCPDDDSNHCHCPGCGAVFNALVAFAAAEVMVFNLVHCNAAVKRQAFYFAGQIPEAVYLPIWQPPKGH